MDYTDAIKLIGLPVENIKTHRQVKVRDVLPQRDGTHTLWLDNGAIVPIGDAEKQWRAVEK